MVDLNDEDKTSTVEIEAHYVPVPIKLEPRESINSKPSYLASVCHILTIVIDQGILQIELLTGRDIHAADRGGERLSFVTVFVKFLTSSRQIRSVRCLPSQWPESVQVSDQEEDAQSRLARELCCPSGMFKPLIPYARGADRTRSRLV